MWLTKFTPLIIIFRGSLLNKAIPEIWYSVVVDVRKLPLEIDA
jgi:hypothetical protein